MTVYVDDMYRYAKGRYGPMRMSHMIADTDEELHAMAEAIGMARRWYQGDHYDISEVRREMAVSAGAVEVTMTQMSSMRRRKHVEGHCGDPESARQWWSRYHRARRQKNESIG